MQISLEKDASKKIDKASKLLGIEKTGLIDRVILFYLDNLSKYLELKEEMRSWDALSDEALSNFECTL